MASVETQNEGEEDMDPIEWLKTNRLDVFIDHFNETQLTISELLTYNENDIDHLIKDCNIKKYVFIKRFKDALRKLQHHQSISKSSSNRFGQIYRVVISNKESENIKRLETKLSELDIVLNDNLSKVSALLEDAQKKDVEIEKVFLVIRNKINEREKQLRNKFNTLSNETVNKLRQQQKKLESYKKLINNSLSEQQAMTLDPNIDSIKRENKIVEITNNTLSNINQQDMMVQVAPIKFTIDQDEAVKYISAVGAVSDRPEAPILVISDVNDTSVKVQFQCETKEEIVGYSLRYKIGENKDNDDEKKEWIDVDTKNADEYILDDLRDDTVYSICGRYKLKTGNIWSDESKLSVFKTLKYDLKICDIIETTKDYQHCDYNIPYVFKIRNQNDVTAFVGCERYEIVDKNKLKIHLPYVYIKKTSEWYRVHGGRYDNNNGQMGGKHIAFILKLEYVKICDDDKEVYYGRRYSDDATNKMKQMYYKSSSKIISTPDVSLLYRKKGAQACDMPWILLQSKKQQIVID
eukprot:191529_1